MTSQLFVAVLVLLCPDHPRNYERQLSLPVYQEECDYAIHHSAVREDYLMEYKHSDSDCEKLLLCVEYKQ